jgi:hypothetical protein
MQDSIFVRDVAVVLIAASVSGWLAQRIGLSAVVGYLLAGILTGPYSPALKVVSNIDHIQLLSQIGLVFLMFAIGLGLSFARLQRLGLSVVTAVIISSIFIFNVCRWFGLIMNWTPIEILFLAGTVMISSSAIIIKALDELNMAHQRSGQLAMGITVLEDIVSVVMLTLFISLMRAGAPEAPPLNVTLGTIITRKSESITLWVEQRQPRGLRDLVRLYHGWLERLQTRGNASVLWRLASRRVFHTILHLLFVSALILFSRPVHDFALNKIASRFPAGFNLLFWSAFGIVLLGPIIVLWRNIEALAMIIAEGATSNAHAPNFSAKFCKLFSKLWERSYSSRGCFLSSQSAALPFGRSLSPHSQSYSGRHSSAAD